MNEYFQNLIKQKGYQIFLFSCPATIPCNFALHPWFVCVHDGNISRWEVRFQKDGRKNSTGNHLLRNALPPFSGIEKFLFFTGRFLWRAKLMGHIKGGENSAAQNIYDFINQSPTTYPYCGKYSLLGPNSNTYVQWIIDRFPDFKVKLPWNSFGKNFKVN